LVDDPIKRGRAAQDRRKGQRDQKRSRAARKPRCHRADMTGRSMTTTGVLLRKALEAPATRIISKIARTSRLPPMRVASRATGAKGIGLEQGLTDDQQGEDREQNRAGKSLQQEGRVDKALNDGGADGDSEAIEKRRPGHRQDGKNQQQAQP
jgi:hypothetical protein